MSKAEEVVCRSFADFLTAEQRSDVRHELVAGRVYVMAGGSERHDLAAGLAYEALAPGVRGRGCRPFTSNRLLRIGSAAYYPDVLVVCGPAAHRSYENDAAIIIEVLSPSTEEVDRREKALACSALPGLRHYLLVDPDRPRIEVGALGENGWDWHAIGPGGVVVTEFGVLEVDELYAALDASATT